MKTACKDFDLKTTLDSGQVFGFVPAGNGRYAGTVLGHAVELWQENDVLHVQNGAAPLSEGLVRSYFDLDRDLKEIYSILRSDKALALSLRTFKGLRLIRQDPWEALACFIISSNNNVKRIMGIYRGLVRYFGRFPSPSQIARSHENILRGLGLGYRAPYLMKTALFLSNSPDYLETIRGEGYEEAKARVISFPGIGPKVADCALLYGFHKLEAFPVDVWIARTMRRIYFRNRRVSEDKIRCFAQKRWRGLAGYVQQYIFHAARRGAIFFGGNGATSRRPGEEGGDACKRFDILLG